MKFAICQKIRQPLTTYQSSFEEGKYVFYVQINWHFTKFAIFAVSCHGNGIFLRHQRMIQSHLIDSESTSSKGIASKIIAAVLINGAIRFASRLFGNLFIAVKVHQGMTSLVTHRLAIPTLMSERHTSN